MLNKYSTHKRRFNLQLNDDLVSKLEVLAKKEKKKLTPLIVSILEKAITDFTNQTTLDLIKEVDRKVNLILSNVTNYVTNDLVPNEVITDNVTNGVTNELPTELPNEDVTKSVTNKLDTNKEVITEDVTNDVTNDLVQPNEVITDNVTNNVTSDLVQPNKVIADNVTNDVTSDLVTIKEVTTDNVTNNVTSDLMPITEVITDNVTNNVTSDLMPITEVITDNVTNNVTSDLDKAVTQNKLFHIENDPLFVYYDAKKVNGEIPLDHPLAVVSDLNLIIKNRNDIENLLSNKDVSLSEFCKVMFGNKNKYKANPNTSKGEHDYISHSDFLETLSKFCNFVVVSKSSTRGLKYGKP